MKKILLYSNIALIISVMALSFWLNNTREEKKRLANNQESLLSDIEYYKTESGENASSVQKLELTKSELERHCQDLTQTVEDLGLKVKRLQSASTTSTKTEVDIQVQVRDSLVYRDKPDTLKKISFKDPWVELDGYIDRNVFTGRISSVDTLVQIIHRIPKRFLFFKWGTKAIRQEVVNKNPHSKIVYTEYIELKR